MVQVQYRFNIPGDDYWRDQVCCQRACPVHTDARGYVRAIARGDLEQAYLIARGPNPLASICGRICGAPCEANCRRGKIDRPIAIRALKRVVTDRFGPHRPVDGSAPATVAGPEHRDYLLGHADAGACRDLEEMLHLVRLQAAGRPRPEGPRVAIIGGGPAGLSCAHDLALLGFRPVIFEAEPVPAGMLYLGVPEYRLPRDLIRAEVAVIEALGVEIRCGVRVGEAVTLGDLRRDFAAVVIAVGLKHSRGLPIPGAGARGVFGGVEFLRSVALGEPIALGRRVVVIGGGNVAYDISRSVLRQEQVDVTQTAILQPGRRHVSLVCLESPEEMPADEIEVREGEEEGVVRHNSWGPVEIVTGDGGAVAAVRFRRCLRVFDDDRRFNPVYDDARVMELPADTVLLSVGQTADLGFLDTGRDGVEVSGRGQIRGDPETRMTSASGVFLTGDVAYGPRLMIHAVADGKQTARAVYRHLTGIELRPEAVQFHVELPGYSRERGYEHLGRHELPALDVEERLKSQRAVVELGFTLAEARAEAGRCLDCGVNTIFDSEKCILCGGCADVCPMTCLKLVPLSALEGGPELDALAAARRIRSGEASAILKDEDHCIRCALCAQRCPTHAITMERLQFDLRLTAVASGRTGEELSA